MAGIISEVAGTKLAINCRAERSAWFGHAASGCHPLAGRVWNKPTYWGRDGIVISRTSRVISAANAQRYGRFTLSSASGAWNAGDVVTIPVNGGPWVFSSFASHDIIIQSSTRSTSGRRVTIRFGEVKTVIRQGSDVDEAGAGKGARIITRSERALGADDMQRMGVIVFSSAIKRVERGGRGDDPGPTAAPWVFVNFSRHTITVQSATRASANRTVSLSFGETKTLIRQGSDVDEVGVEWASVLGKPATATRWPSWGEVSSKPSTFPPSSHSHPYIQGVKNSAGTVQSAVRYIQIVDST